MTDEEAIVIYREGQIVRSKASGCGHEGIFRILYRTEPNEAPSILGEGHPLAYRCKRLANDGSELGCPKPSTIGAELYFFHHELEPLEERR